MNADKYSICVHLCSAPGPRAGVNTSLFIIPLVLGFAFNLASAGTTAFSRRWGERRSSLITVVLRDILGIPIWATGFVLAVRTPSPTLLASPIAIQIIGWLSLAIGGAIILAALLTIGWRAAAPSAQDTLVHKGIYTYVRHPIYTGMFLEFIGVFLIIPTQTVALASVLGGVWVLAQTKLEEIDLLQRLPEYREYLRQTPRFLPRLRIGDNHGRTQNQSHHPKRR